MRRTLLFSLTALALTTAGCGAGADTPATTAAPASATTAAPDRPERIVSLSATHTEVLYAIGAADQIIGTDLTSNYPPEADDTAKVDAFNFDVEELAALEPDLVVLAFDFNGEMAALAALDIPALLLTPALTLEEAYDQITALGTATGHASEAEKLVADMRAGIGEAVASVPDVVGTSYFHEVDSTLFSANSGTFLGDLYDAFGLANIADEVPDEFASGYVQVSPEFVIESDPDFIFLGDAAFGETAETVAARPGWETMTAVKEGRVVELDSDIAGRWGPRTVVLAEQIAGALGGAAP